MTGRASVDVRQLLTHPKPSQLLYQLKEIVDERVYLQHGVTVGPGDVVLDAGANVGVAAAFFAAECGATVHSFEPVTPIYEILRRNVAQFPTVTAHNAGLSSTNRRAPITYYPNADAMSGLYADPEVDREFAFACMRNLGVPAEDAERALSGRYDGAVQLTCELRTVTAELERLAIDRVRLLKVDVEHSELEVLDGIAADDWHRIDQIVIEVHDRDGRLATITDVLGGHGFAITTEEEQAMRGTGCYLLYATRAQGAGGA
jgi:FkbM family methyltransferase